MRPEKLLRYYVYWCFSANTPNFQWNSDDLIVLGHTDMFNKYCLWAAPSISFLSWIRVFYGGTPAWVAYTLSLCMFPPGKHLIFYYFVLLLYCTLCNHNHRQFMLNIITCSDCDLSVCSRSWGLVSRFPTHCQLPTLVLHPAFLWRAAARSHHLCGILHC